MTPKERAAMQQALMYFEAIANGETVKPYEVEDTITALREALDHSGEANEMVAEQAEPSQLADASLEPVASVEEWVARPHPEDIKRLEEQRSIGYWDSRLNDVCWHEGLVNADLQHGQPLYAAPVRTKDHCNPLQDLTDDELLKIWQAQVPASNRVYEFARAVIAADREKNK